MTKQIQNPAQAFGQTDAESNFYQEIAEFKCRGTITAGDGVGLIWDETARTLLATAWDTNASGESASSGIGVALESGVAGDIIRVVKGGFALANIGSDTPAFGESIVGTTTAGVLAAVASDATTVAGTVIGFCLGDEDAATNKVPIWVATA